MRYVDGVNHTPRLLKLEYFFVGVDSGGGSIDTLIMRPVCACFSVGNFCPDYRCTPQRVSGTTGRLVPHSVAVYGTATALGFDGRHAVYVFGTIQHSLGTENPARPSLINSAG